MGNKNDTLLMKLISYFDYKKKKNNSSSLRVLNNKRDFICVNSNCFQLLIFIVVV